MEMEMDEIRWFHNNKKKGILGSWNIGILGQEKNFSLFSQYSIIPSLHYSGTILYSFPLDRAGRFGTDIINDPVDPLHLVDNSIGKMLQNFIGQPDPIRCHTILAPDHP